ncbi:hypothetical protein ZIOFF_061641 [Zingiber officinale]|uniref:Uncharacterized protein n=1 Tax=Zingiber officinale TaxID=94328 RepID=A0A8J5EZD7_ZINOF|nr:hypothetical protein ZIOFF_061641 [Zingiber officinale]
MSTCGDCSCADKSQCVKKGTSYTVDIVETEKSYLNGVVDGAASGEQNEPCQCGPACACVDCQCGVI